jgi:dihydrolipoamide dehydrogenase
MAMNERMTIEIPDIGDFPSVDVIEVLVSPGDKVEPEQGLITLETDKATMDIPAPYAGTVVEVLVKAGDKVSKGTPFIVLDATDAVANPSAAEVMEEPPQVSEAPPESAGAAQMPEGDVDMHAPLLVLGAGPGGYTAAFRAADLGQEVVLVERWNTLGGVCLNVGCIPSKALLHAAKVMEEAEAAAEIGIRFARPEVDLEKLVAWKDGVVGKLTGGLDGLSKRRKVSVVHGVARFVSSHRVLVTSEEGEKLISFDQCIIAAGSEPMRLPGTPDDPRVMDSTGALKLEELPERMLVIGGGIIGLEMATVYAALGVKITVVELTDGLMPGCDPDLVKPLAKRLEARYENIMLGTRVASMAAEKDGIHVQFTRGDEAFSEVFGRVLVAVGRTPNGNGLNAGAASVDVNERGFITVDKQMRTSAGHIFAIGDIVGQPMLAHKATHEARVAAEVAAGHKSNFDARVIPSVAYTDPEIAWCGLTEIEADNRGIKVGKGVFPWAASGRSLAMARDEGLTKLLFDPESGKVLGAGIVGPNAGDLIGEVVLAIEMGCDAADIGLSIHPHPTLCETVGLAAEAFEGTITDLYMPRKK